MSRKRSRPAVFAYGLTQDTQGVSEPGNRIGCAGGVEYPPLSLDPLSSHCPDFLCSGQPLDLAVGGKSDQQGVPDNVKPATTNSEKQT